MGLALTACTLPAAGRPGFDLGEDEMEWGLGIHGEPGVQRSALQPVDRVVERLLSQILDDRGIVAGRRVALLVNGLGATPPMELSIVAGAAVRDLQGRGVQVQRLWVGSFLTALDMAGCSLSVLAVDDDLLSALDAPTSAPAWTPAAFPVRATTIAVDRAPLDEPAGALDADDPVRRVLTGVARALIDAEEELTAMDRVVGDGDLGTSLARGAAAILRESATYPGQHGAAAVLRAASATVRRSVGGTSGPLYTVLLLRAAAALAVADELGPRQWAAAFAAGTDGVRQVGGAAVGDRTMVDALIPAVEAFAAGLDSGDWRPALDGAIRAARDGAAGTAALRARLGRSSYLGDRVLGHPDPGAQAVVVWLEAVAAALID
jgi:dihydroxyacetone kinase